MSISKIDITKIVSRHLASFKGKDKRFTKEDKWFFFYLPSLAATIIGFWELPKSSIKENISICVSILIGLLLNLLVLLLSNLSAKGTTLSKKNRTDRLILIKETYYNVSFTTILCIITLIALFLSEIGMNSFISRIIGDKATNLITLISSHIVGIILYFLSIQIFLHLFLVLKRINKIFSSDIKYFKED